MSAKTGALNANPGCPAPGEWWEHQDCGRVKIVRPRKHWSMCELPSGARRVLNNSLMHRSAPPAAGEAPSIASLKS